MYLCCLENRVGKMAVLETFRYFNGIKCLNCLKWTGQSLDGNGGYCPGTCEFDVFSEQNVRYVRNDRDRDIK